MTNNESWTISKWAVFLTTKSGQKSLNPLSMIEQSCTFCRDGKYYDQGGFDDTKAQS